jgi:hypothetical protein
LVQSRDAPWSDRQQFEEGRNNEVSTLFDS